MATVSTQLRMLSTAAPAANLLTHGRLLLLICLFFAAFGARLYHVTDPPLGFHATRQYRSLLLAREYYFEGNDSVPAWEREVAATSAQRQGMLEPPVLEHVVALGYRLTGESLWLPKVLSSLFWLVGGVFVYRLARRLAGAGAAALSTAFYLFLPFAVVASRSFQPDPLMVMLILGSVLAMAGYAEQPTRTRFGLMVAAAAWAFFIKPIALFPLLAVFLSLSIATSGVRASLRSRATVAFLLVTVLPTLIVYTYGIVSGTFLVKEAEKTLLPQLVLSAFFWHNWLDNIASVVSLPILAAALIGSALLRERASKALMLGLWIGYVLFCLVVNYNLATHDYYQLQLIAIVALGMAPLARLFVRSTFGASARLPLRAAAGSLLALALLVSAQRAMTRLGSPASASEPAIAEQIGAQVQHSTRTIYLSGDYGVPLEYHGLLSGAAWPIASDLEWEQLAGHPRLSAEQRFQAWFAQDSPEYFVVMDLHELDDQPDLREFLTHNFVQLAQTPEYWLFDLRRPGFLHAPEVTGGDIRDTQ
jgi:4-amino-4-deoxy-L-arabinose transferase-like glycosyltransferase